MSALPVLIGHKLGDVWTLMHRDGDGTETRMDSRPGQGIVSAVEDLVQKATAAGVVAALSPSDSTR